MKKYCRFLETIKDEEEIVLEKDEEYLVTYEDSDAYYFSKPITRGIDKQYKNKLFKVVIYEE